MKMKERMLMALAGLCAMGSAHASISEYATAFPDYDSTVGWHVFTMPPKATGTPQLSRVLAGAASQDYWNGDDAVVQTSKLPADAADVIAAGGTITGDGLLADGALIFIPQDNTAGNEYIAYDIGGTMDEGEEITFDFGLFNNYPYQSYTQGQLWDITAGKELAVSPWHLVLSQIVANYKPIEGTVSYTATAAEAGHQLAIVFREWNSSSAPNRRGYIDNIMVTSVIPEAIAGITNNFTEASSVNGWYNFGSVDAAIAYSSGSGPSWDYWDGDDAVVQGGRTSSESNDVVAAGGTITGDGMLADGALWFDVQDEISGNESIAFTLGGEMVEGEVIHFSYNAFNNVPYYNIVQGQLWDMTTTNQLAVANWVTVLANNAVDYSPYNAAVSYFTTAAEAGHKLAIVFREWVSAPYRDPYIDNIKVATTLTDPEEMYQRWASNSGLTALNNGYTADPDGDTLDNLYEYAIGGDPLDGADWGTLPTGGVSSDNGTNGFDYAYARRSDFWLGGLDYHLETRSNLVDGADWADGDFGLVGVGEPGGTLDYVTNRIATQESAQFARMIIGDPMVRPPASEQISSLEENVILFSNGAAGIHTYRIPALITATNGDLIACCDGRRYSSADLRESMDTDIVYRRSTDNGATWSPMAKVCDFGYGYPASDSSLVLDRTTGEIFCFYNYMDQITAPGETRLYLQRSTDYGATWSSALDITDQLLDTSAHLSRFIISGRGIQLRDGRLLHTLVNLLKGLYVFGSEDHGATWQRIDVPINPANESKVVELNDGSWMVNSRVDYSVGYRWVHISEDEGQSWSSLPDPNLADPGCNASIIRYTSVLDGYAKNRLLFCNANDPDVRENLTVRISYDEGKSWSEGKVIVPGPSAYSSLTICEDGSIGVLYYDLSSVRFVRFTLEALTDGKDSLSIPYQL